MKLQNIAPILIVLFGCGQKSPYDISPAQAQSHMMVRGAPSGGPGGAIDLRHLPPGAVKKERLIKKGERLPDGRIADHDMKVVTVTIDKQVRGHGTTDQRVEIRN